MSQRNMDKIFWIVATPIIIVILMISLHFMWEGCQQIGIENIFQCVFMFGN